MKVSKSIRNTLVALLLALSFLGPAGGLAIKGISQPLPSVNASSRRKTAKVLSEKHKPIKTRLGNGHNAIPNRINQYSSETDNPKGRNLPRTYNKNPSKTEVSIVLVALAGALGVITVPRFVKKDR